MAESKQLYDFRKQVAALKKFSGRGTELISVYVTPGYPIAEIAAKLRDEQGQAGNIKSKSTRKSVVDALEKILQYLKTFKEIPKNGIAIFCGNVSETEGRTDIRIFSVIPPAPLQVQFYRCESRFVVEPLEEMLEQKGVYGLVVLDGKEATVALLKGKQIQIIKRLHSTAQQKVVKGGQSQGRFQRIHEETTEVYYKRIGEAMAPFTEQKNLQGIIVGGPGPAKDNFMKLKPFDYRFKVLGVVDIGYTDEYGLRELLDKAGELIEEQESIQEKRLVEEFMKQASREGLVAYGFDAVSRALQARKASRLLVSEDLELKRVKFECRSCRKQGEEVVERSTETDCECGGKTQVVEEEDVVSELIALAESQGIQVELISRETAEGSLFYGTFKGLGAFLRYK